MTALRYLSVCSGIEAASVAWKPLDWEAAAFAEIEAAPRAVLAHHWPEVPLHGDFTTIRADEYGPVRLLVGGTPCQSFSVAGLRGGLADDRGNLALEYLRLAQRLRPEWLVWENVPGVLSSNAGRDFGAILGGMVELGYGFAYRVLDAQYVRVDGHGRAVPQRRRRVFVVGHLGDWRRAAAVLFERACLRGDPAPRREAGQRPAPTLSARTQGGGGLGTDFDCDGGLIPAHFDVAHPLRAQPNSSHRSDSDNYVGVAHALRGEGFDASEDGTGRGPPIVPIAFGGNDTRGPIQVATAVNAHGGPHGRLDFESETFIASAFDARQSDVIQYGPITGPLDTDGQTIGVLVHADAAQARSAKIGWAVRRLTPLEAERLQGFPKINNKLTVRVCGDEKIDNAPSVARASQAPNLAESEHAAVHVRINLERQAVEIRRAGKLIWSANTAEQPSSSPLSMPLDVFVRLAAHMTATEVRRTRAGRAAFLLNATNSSDPWSGSAFVDVSGHEIVELASDAKVFTDTVSSLMKSIISQAGRNSENSEPISAISFCCVVAAIASCIPQATSKASSYTVVLETTQGFTAIPWRGGVMADGPRYKMLGNSMAVNCMRWIGRRIEAVDSLGVEAVRAA